MSDRAKIIGFAHDRAYSWVVPAVQTLRREQWPLPELTSRCHGSLADWARAIGERVIRDECDGAVIFSDDAGLVACVLNKMPTIRAVSVTSVFQAARATLTLAANVLVVEMPGRTYYEVRQIIRELCQSCLPCPEAVAGTLKELDGHAHR